MAARELDVPVTATFTTFAFNRQLPSPTGISRALVAAAAGRSSHRLGLRACALGAAPRTA